ncbi:AtpZ/AtpI family protein [Candidatus Sneabacter namystus]|uniref:AtpZ/AtpI family protein n=1 Tax=Candidatus Sneabacter namystus TaxID=2601646 RepID=A0A5C0UHZ3_9RICK|nr:AtpZ/AtpI family protein [Candidatus Sneabacter namystus]QEK39676.1 AtpZ/AtpI family protein [Candidatus Sneabacter namystus]
MKHIRHLEEIDKKIAVYKASFAPSKIEHFNHNRGKCSANYIVCSTIIQLISFIGTGFFLGRVLDRCFGTFPVCFTLSMLLSVIAWLYNLVKMQVRNGSQSS